jgi:hypothetical protein
MPYIDKTKVAEIRKDLKSTFPNFKFSVTRSDYSGVRIAILAGDIDFGTEYQQVNHHHINSLYQGEVRQFLKLIADFAKKDQKVLVEDGDYGTVPNYYVNISVGDWDKPYKFNK